MSNLYFLAFFVRMLQVSSSSRRFLDSTECPTSIVSTEMSSIVSSVVSELESASNGAAFLVDSDGSRDSEVVLLSLILSDCSSGLSSSSPSPAIYKQSFTVKFVGYTV